MGVLRWRRHDGHDDDMILFQENESNPPNRAPYAMYARHRLESPGYYD